MNQPRVFKISFKSLLNEILKGYNIPLPKWDYEFKGDQGWKAKLEIINPLDPDLKLYFHSYGYKEIEEAEQQGAKNAIHYLQTLLDFKVDDVNYKQMQYSEIFLNDTLEIKYDLMRENEELRKQSEDLLNDNAALRTRLEELESNDEGFVAMN